MKSLIILITPAIEELINSKAVDIEVVQVFGSESIVVGEKVRYVRGDSAIVKGKPAEFHKLVRMTGELWTSTNPMLGDWNSYILEDVVENNS